MSRDKSSWQIWAVTIWLVLVIALSAWWLVFGIRTIHQLGDFVQSADLLKKRNMLIMEGSTLILLLIVGGGALIYFARREQKNMAEVKHFFSTFSHDLKTSISRVVLQAEALPKVAGADEKLKAFHKNLLTLEMQLENSLHFAQQQSRALTLEPVQIKSIIARLHTQWPDLKIRLQGQGEFLGDKVAVESIFKNLISNSLIHGKADEISIQVIPDGAWVMITIADNGQPVDIDVAHLGQRLQSSSHGTGIGLYLVSQWVTMLKGSIHFSKTESQSLQVVLRFPSSKKGLA